MLNDPYITENWSNLCYNYCVVNRRRATMLMQKKYCNV